MTMLVNSETDLWCFCTTQERSVTATEYLPRTETVSVLHYFHHIFQALSFVESDNGIFVFTPFTQGRPGLFRRSSTRRSGTVVHSWLNCHVDHCEALHHQCLCHQLSDTVWRRDCDGVKGWSSEGNFICINRSGGASVSLDRAVLGLDWC